MDHQAAIAGLIQADPWRMHCLKAVRDIGLPDWPIAAGFVRNLIWDHLHGRTFATPLNDVDVVFFDRADLSTGFEQRIEAQLSRIGPDVSWQVRNQARMHLRNGHLPYRHAADAISYYPELETCIGARLDDDGKVEVVAPHGMENHWSLSIRRNPKAAYPKSLTEARIAGKRWLEIWPQLRIAR